MIRLTLSVIAPTLEDATATLSLAANDAKETVAKDAKHPNEDNNPNMWGHISLQRFSWLTVEPKKVFGSSEMMATR